MGQVTRAQKELVHMIFVMNDRPEKVKETFSLTMKLNIESQATKGKVNRL